MEIESIDKVVRRGRNKVPYVIASIFPVHAHGCPLTRLGKSHGECSCGAQKMFEDFMSCAGYSPWLYVHATTDCSKKGKT